LENLQQLFHQKTLYFSTIIRFTHNTVQWRNQAFGGGGSQIAGAKTSSLVKYPWFFVRTVG